MDERTKSAGSLADSVRIVAYWTLTLAVAWEMVAGSTWDLLRIEYVRVVLTHLGYPLYLLLILGAWKLPGALVLLVPRLPRLKEWAYAGAFFNYSGAAASHALVGDGPRVWVAPLVFCVLTVASWALRPRERRLVSPSSETGTTLVAWTVPIVIAIVMLIAALLTLPRGPSPF
jgi:hypothetical protein